MTVKNRESQKNHLIFFVWEYKQRWKQLVRAFFPVEYAKSQVGINPRRMRQSVFHPYQQSYFHMFRECIIYQKTF